VVEATGAGRAQAEAALQQTGFEVKPAILMILAGINAEEALQRLQKHDGYLRAALTS
jgi:N-acetylmuramic acid 6-phosphate etherase